MRKERENHVRNPSEKAPNLQPFFPLSFQLRQAAISITCSCPPMVKVYVRHFHSPRLVQFQRSTFNSNPELCAPEKNCPLKLCSGSCAASTLCKDDQDRRPHRIANCWPPTLTLASSATSMTQQWQRAPYLAVYVLPTSHPKV